MSFTALSAQMNVAPVRSCIAPSATRQNLRSVRMRAEGEDSPAEKAVAKVTREVKEVGGLYPMGASTQSLSYLDGSLPGDFGFDPLGLYDPDGQGGFISQDWLRYAEVIHGRYAMLGAAGILTPELLARFGVIPEATNVPWWETSVIGPTTTFDNYWMDPWSLFFIEVVLMQFAELRRLQDFRKPGSMGKQYFLGLEAIFEGSGDPAYPGGPFFNMFNLGKDPEAMQTLKTKEIKNGRLAMLAIFGFGAQAIITHQSPVTNLLDHVSSPNSANMLTNFASVLGGQ